MKTLLLACMLLPMGAIAATPSGTGGSSGLFPAFAGLDARPRVRSVAELRFNGVVRQAEDYSCGAAALATLLTHHYGDPITEADILSSMMRSDKADRIRVQGLSMLDMKSFLEARGYAADGYRSAADVLLAKVRVPVIALINVQGYRHFVVVKGMRRQMLLLGDPARGLRRVSLKDFKAMAGDALLLVKSHASQGRRYFDHDDDWHAVPPAPLQADIFRPHSHSMPIDILTSSPF